MNFNFPRRIAPFLAAVLTAGSGACSSKADGSPAPQARPSTATGAAPTAPPSAPPAPVPAPSPINLLTAVATDVAVSSVYRNDATQVAHLVDDDLGTAWNARSRELTASWVAIRVPDAAHVHSLAMTAGFTATLGERDLFTGNQRVAKVRVLHNETPVGEHVLDTESRDLQTIPVDRTGGVVRIEFVELRPGERPTWLETCVSELRVMGHAEGAVEGSRFPRLHVGAMPEPETLADEEVDRRVVRAAVAFESAFGAMEADVRRYMADTAEPGVPTDEAPRLRAARARALRAFGESVGLLDGSAGDRIRRLALGERDARDLDTVTELLATPLTTARPTARCAIASALVSLRLRRLADNVATQAMFDEMDEAMGGARGPDLSRFADAFEGYARDWRRSPARVAAAVARSRVPPAPATTADLDAARALLTAHSPACGW